MFQRILVPLDGSSRAERAIPVAAHLAQATGRSITLLRVVTHPHDAVAYLLQPPEKADAALEAQHAEAVGYLSRLSGSHELAGVETTMNVADSNPAQTILSAVQLQRMDSIVMCNHGTAGFMRWTLGSVAQKVVRHSTVPVLLLREGEALHALFQSQNSPHPLHVMVALDGSAFAETALLPATFLCSALSASADGEIKLTLVLTGVENEQQSRSEEIKSMKNSAEVYLEMVKQRHREN